MPFKTDKQRKAFFARQNNPSQNPNPVMTSKDLRPTSKQLVAVVKKADPKGFRKMKDSDKDGHPDVFDSKPFDPKKQSFLHDFQVKRLRKQEEKLETIREKEQKKLEDLKDKLKERGTLAEKKLDIKTLKAKRKQIVIDEIVREKKKLSEIRQVSIDAKNELDRFTFTGKLKKGAKLAIKKSNIVLEKAGVALGQKIKKEFLKDIKKRKSTSRPKKKKVKKDREEFGFD